jgi:hypothetical protein
LARRERHVGNRRRRRLGRRQEWPSGGLASGRGWRTVGASL